MYLTVYPESFSVDTFTFSRYIIVSSVDNDDLIFSFLIVEHLISAYMFYCIKKKNGECFFTLDLIGNMSTVSPEHNSTVVLR